jgi:hypothetical protein
MGKASGDAAMRDVHEKKMHGSRRIGASDDKSGLNEESTDAKGTVKRTYTNGGKLWLCRSVRILLIVVAHRVITQDTTYLAVLPAISSELLQGAGLSGQQPRRGSALSRKCMVALACV